MASLATEGRLGYLTPIQKEALEKAKLFPGADPQLFDDHYLLRFLRARNFDLEKTETMWTNFIKWRKDAQVDEILETFDFSEYNAFHQAYPRIYHGTDKLGRPIYIERLGKIDHSKLSIITTPERMIRYHIYEYEKLIRYRFKACSAKAAVNIEQSTTILDLSGVSLSAFSSVVTLIRQISAIAQDYYPEVMGKMYILNAPMLFSAVWSLISPLLNAVTVSKISILGSSYKSNVLELINEGMLPDFLGGTVKHPTWIGVDSGPWNDGLTPGFPIEALEKAPIKSLK